MEAKLIYRNYEVITDLTNSIYSYYIRYPIEPILIVTMNNVEYSLNYYDYIRYVVTNTTTTINDNLLDSILSNINAIPSIPNTNKPYTNSTLKITSLESLQLGYERVRIKNNLIMPNTGDDILLKYIDSNIPNTSLYLENKILSVGGLLFPVEYHPAMNGIWYVKDCYKIIDTIYCYTYSVKTNTLNLLYLPHNDKIHLSVVDIISYNDTVIGIEVDRNLDNLNLLLTIGGCILNGYTVNNNVIILDLLNMEYYKRIAILEIIYRLTGKKIPLEYDYMDINLIDTILKLPGSYLYIMDKKIETYVILDGYYQYRLVEMGHMNIPLVTRDLWLNKDSILYNRVPSIESKRLNGDIYKLYKEEIIGIYM